MKPIKEVSIYTDGACSGNPGKGGWAAILIYQDTEKKISGYDPDTTNNRMELLSVIRGVAMLKERCDVTIFSDSAYVVNAFIEKWIDKWQKNGWKTQDKKPVKNMELWQELLDKLKLHRYKFVKVEGHSSNQYNNECDRMAKASIKENS